MHQLRDNGSTCFRTEIFLYFAALKRIMVFDLGPYINQLYVEWFVAIGLAIQV